MESSVISTPSYKLMISDGLESKLLGVPEDLKVKIAENWSLPRSGIKNDAATYRFINYLTETGLLDDRREVAGKGWRKFSYVECIYLNIVVALRKLGVKAEAIKPVHELFSQPFEPNKANLYHAIDWLEVLLAVHAGDEMELIVDDSGEVRILDPAMMWLFGTGQSKGSIRISLSTMVNELRIANSLNPITIKNNFGNLPLNEAEIATIIDMRGLNQGQDMLKIRRTLAGTLVEKEKTETADSDTSDIVNALLKEDFASVVANKKEGKVVNVKKTTQTLYKD